MARQQRDLNRERMWRQHIAEQQSSGQTIRAYCVTHRLHENSFYSWRQEIAKRDREAASRPNPTPAFVPVAVIDSPASPDSPIDIRLTGGHRLRIRSGCDRGPLADVLAIVRDFLGHSDPLAGHLFAFRNKSGDRLKIIWWDRDGLVIFYKRLEEGGFPFPMPAADAKEVEMTAADLQLVLQGIDPQKVKRTRRYQRPATE